MARFPSVNRNFHSVCWGWIDLPVLGDERESVCGEPLLHEWTFWPSVQTTPEPQGSKAPQNRPIRIRKIALGTIFLHYLLY